MTAPLPVISKDFQGGSNGILPSHFFILENDAREELSSRSAPHIAPPPDVGSYNENRKRQERGRPK
jgi:hypothetical protein